MPRKRSVITNPPGNIGAFPLPLMDAVIRAELGGLFPGDRLALVRWLWREPVWDLKMVAGRHARAEARSRGRATLWRFITERLAELDGWAVADTLAPCRLALSDRRRGASRRGRALDDEPRISGRAAPRWCLRCPGRKQARSRAHARLGGEAHAATANGSFRRRSAGGCANCRNATLRGCAGFSMNMAQR